MEETFKFIKDARNAFINLIDGLTIEQLNEVPQGFNNNIIWNFGHIVVSTPMLCYVRTGIWEDASRIQFVDSYKKGTKPAAFVMLEEVFALKELALSSIQQLEEDYNNGVFNKITPFDTVTFGVMIDNIEELLVTTAGHDNTHFGYAAAQRRLVNPI